MLRSAFSLAIASTLLLASPVAAHFPWIDVDNNGHAVMFFGENPSQRDYHTPECVAEAKLMQLHKSDPATEVAHTGVDTKEFVGRRSTEKLEADSVLAMTCEYGIYHGTRLVYYSRHQPLDALPTSPASGNALDAVLIKTKAGIDIIVKLDGEPLQDAEVTLIDGKGESAKSTTNTKGEASFSSIAAGKVGFIVGNTIKEGGKIGDQEFTSQSHYLTVTTNYAVSDLEKQELSEKLGSDLPTLPAPIASFGAVTCDGYLYVYSGHTGRAHAHSRENLSTHFVRVKIDGGDEWETLPMEQPLQGLPIVAHGGKVYRVGGLDARNATADDEEELHSVDTFAEFDPATKTWKKLASLPNGRSSHNAVVIGDKLFVVGGWTLSGDDDGDWRTDSLVYDFANPSAGWKKLPTPPFTRRALAVGTAGGKLYAAGGIDDIGSVSNNVFEFDLKSQKWAEVANYPGEAMYSFGLASWGMGDSLYAAGMDGTVHKLSGDRSEWQEVVKLETPRFFHQLVPDGNGGLIAVAGASPKHGHVGTSERVEVAGE